LLLTAGSQLLWQAPSYSGQIQPQRKKERGDFLQIQESKIEKRQTNGILPLPVAQAESPIKGTGIAPRRLR
jgi:hypothetical protein